MSKMIDVFRCMNAMKHLVITGHPRPSVIDDAIGLIQMDGAAALSSEYLGVKNYAHFGDQRADCSYGMAPSHGHIVFSIARVGERSVTLGRDHVYLLECVRDFGSRTLTPDGSISDGRVPSAGKVHNLCDVLRAFIAATETVERLDALLDNARVDSHESPNVPS